LNLPAQKAALKQVFASINLSTVLANDGLDWLRPALTNYCFKGNTQSPSSSFLAMLSLTGDPVAAAAKLPLLTQEVSPGIVTPDVKAGYLISDQLYLQNMVLPQVHKKYESVGNSAGMVYNADQIAVLNSNSFVVDSVKPNAISYDLHVDPNDFKIYLNGGQLKCDVRVHINVSPGIVAFMTSSATYDMVYDTKTQNYTLQEVSGSPVTDHWTKVDDGVIIGEAIAGVIAAAIGAGIGKIAESVVVGIIALIILGVITAIPQWIQLDGIAGVKEAEMKFDIFFDGVYTTTWAGAKAFHFCQASLVKGFLLQGSVDLTPP